ncbi:hypothetical protein CTAYLR_004034 [Chrysophaeum taylorii]|uniref:Uncharacterized protein n=1 Tax=Chrysophaeum taylorii TaxID=2483200 RepID=A0AAD7U9K5_9STRA|nr:hypothetical protein CTAYLR_004034 [Chrysophaeum taylorii]
MSKLPGKNTAAVDSFKDRRERRVMNISFAKVGFVVYFTTVWFGLPPKSGGSSSRPWATGALPRALTLDLTVRFIVQCASVDGTYAFQACPYACRTCYACDDDPDWSIPSDTTKNCDWVGTDSGSRCSRYGVSNGETFLDFLQRRDACQVCPGSAEVCENDPTWYKNGEPDKDCDWVAGFAPAPRCITKGQDGTFAYEKCKVACDTC